MHLVRGVPHAKSLSGIEQGQDRPLRKAETDHLRLQERPQLLRLRNPARQCASLPKMGRQAEPHPRSRVSGRLPVAATNIRQDGVVVVRPSSQVLLDARELGCQDPSRARTSD